MDFQKVIYEIVEKKHIYIYMGHKCFEVLWSFIVYIF